MWAVDGRAANAAGGGAARGLVQYRRLVMVSVISLLVEKLRDVF